MRTIILSLMLIVAPLVVVADEPSMPEFRAPPQKYTHQHEISRVGSPSPDTVVDELLIGDVTEKELKYYFYLIGTNGHICGGSGIAIAENGSYYYTEKTFTTKFESKDGKLNSWKEPVECRLRIQFDSNHASLHDEGNYCQRSHCGTRAGIGNVRFSRAK